MLKHLNTKFLIIITLVIFLIILMIYVYKRYFNTNPSYVANREYIKIGKGSGSDKDGGGPSGDGGNNFGKICKNDGGDGDGGDGEKKYAHVILFSASWCPYCNKLKESGVFDQFKKDNDGKVVNGYTLNITNEDCSDDKDSKVQKLLGDYNIDGFPTIKIHKDGELASESKDFNCDPSLENFNRFVKDSI